MTLESDNLEQTHEMGRRLGVALTKGDVVALVGPLGSGKTTLVRGVAEGAGVRDPRDVNSPTFVIVNEYEAERPDAPLRLYHIDTYRLRHGGDLEALGFDEMLAEGAVLIEWAERVADLLPADVLTIAIEPLDDHRRRFSWSAHGPRASALLAAGLPLDRTLPNLRIEPMSDADHAEVSALLRACFNWLADREGFTAAQRAFLVGSRSSVETVREESKTRPHWVARAENGAILGIAAIRANELARLYVDPRYHRQGIGRRLFEAAESLIREGGHTQMTVGALVESAAAFYRARGMHEIGRESYEPEIFTDREVVLLAKSL